MAHRPLILLTLLAVAACPAAAGDPPRPPVPAAPTPRALTPEQAADAALATLTAKDDAALTAIAAKDEPDPWLVADELIRRGEHDAAEAFARAAPRVDTEALPAYVASRRDKTDDSARRGRLAAASAALDAGRPAAALDALGPEEHGPIDDVVGVRRAIGCGTALRAVVRHGEALTLQRRAAEAAQRLGWLRRGAVLWAEVGETAHKLREFSAARAAYETALSISERRGDARLAAAALGNLGHVHSALGDHAKALTTHERVLITMEALGDRARAGTALFNIAGIHIVQRDYAKALAFSERALAAKEAVGDTAGVAQTLGNIAWLHKELGDYAAALATFERVLAARAERGDRAGVAATLSSIGYVHEALGDYVKALEFHDRALAAQEALGHRAGGATTLIHLGMAHGNLGDYAKALAFLERALAASEALGDGAGVAAALGNIGVVNNELGEHANALALYERALMAKLLLGKKEGAATTLFSIGAAHFNLGEYAKALATYERALVEFEALGSKGGAVETQSAIGSVHLAMGNHAEALAVQERALAAYEALGDKLRAARTLWKLGHVHASRGDPGAALLNFERAARSARSLRAVPLLVEALRSLAHLHLYAGAASRALVVAREALHQSNPTFRGLGDEQGAQARERLVSLYGVGALAAAREADVAGVLEFLESGRAGALLDVLGRRETLRWKAETLPEDLLAADRKAQGAERAARLVFERAAQGSDRAARAAAGRALDDALEELRAVQSRIERATKSAAGLFYPRAGSLEEIQASLEQGDALVLYGLCLEEALALVVRPEGERLVMLGKAAEVAAACEVLDVRKPDEDPSTALADLKRLLIEPLGLGAEVTRVLVSPEGPLSLLPWGALLDRPVALTPSGTTHALLVEEQREPGEGVLALGAPDYAGVSEGAKAIYWRGRPLTDLPATKGEAERVGTKTLLGAQASEDGLRTALAERPRWRAVHFACHGLVDPNRPTLSSLALTRGGEQDGFLTALEVLRMQFPADMATLSACETGTGKVVGGEGIVGLTRAFMYAGTPRVLCSLWKVDDEATAALMSKFYECWLGSTLSEPGVAPGESKGMSAADALRQAQEFIRAQERWKHPYYWAAWVLWGLP